MTDRIYAYQHGIYPRSEAVVAATRDLERNRTTEDVVADRFRQDLDELVAVQREAGVDLFTDGLLRWQDIFRPLVTASGGMHARTLVRLFDNNAFFRAPELDGPPALQGLPAEYDTAEVVPSPRVATLPSPFMFSRAAQTTEDRNALMLELTTSVLRPVIELLVERGYELIHLQDPWLAYFGIEDGDWGDLEKALGEIRDAVAGRAPVVLHTYFGDVGRHLDRLRRLPVDGVGVDLMEVDPEQLGTDWDTGLLLGILDGRRSVVEPAEELVQEARQILDATQPPVAWLSSNSDLELLPRDVAAAKIRRLGEATRMLRETLG